MIDSPFTSAPAPPSPFDPPYGAAAFSLPSADLIRVKAMSAHAETGGGALVPPPEFRGRKPDDNRDDEKGMVGDSLQAAGRWLAEKWEALEARYGRRAALAMAIAALATFPVPFNVTAIVGVAEAIRGLHGVFSGKELPRRPRLRSKGLRFRVKAGSYFGECERDDEGHCLPSGQSEGKPEDVKKKPNERNKPSAEAIASATKEPIVVERRGEAGRRGIAKAGVFFTDTGESTPEYGENVVSATIKPGTRIYRGEASTQEFAEANGLMNKLDHDVKKITGKLSLAEALEATMDGSLDTDTFYDAFQTVARRELEARGYQGAFWSEEEDLTPLQYQVWDQSAIERGGTSKLKDKYKR